MASEYIYGLMQNLQYLFPFSSFISVLVILVRRNTDAA